MIRNVHERHLHAEDKTVGTLIDSLSGQDDRLWPRNSWPAMRLDGPLRVGAAGGHGPVRYFVTHYEPGRYLTFRFTAPAGFIGSHSFTVIPRTESSTVLRHELVMSTSGTARITWPVFYRPLHDALVEDCLDLAEQECGGPSSGYSRRTVWKVLRSPFAALIAKRRKRHP